MTPFARVAVLRLGRSLRVRVAVAGWSLLALSFAATARADHWTHGADEVLVSVFGALCLPLACHTLVAGAFASSSLARANASLVAFGALPVRAALGTLAAGAAAATLWGAAVGAIVALLAHGGADPPLLRDALASAYAGGLGAAAYAALFGAGTTLGPRGGGRVVLLVADWIFGSGSGATAMLTPRAHLRNLLGEAGPLDVSQRTSALCCILVVVAGTLIVARAAARR